MTKTHTLRWAGRLLMLVLLVLSACERPPMQPVQKGYRGTGMAIVANPRTVEEEAPLHEAPQAAKPAKVRANAPLAGNTYKNIQVLGDLTIGEFGRTMNSITAWVAPKQSCAYCHVDGDFSSDAKYTKVVARQMFQMVRHLNTDWKQHVGDTGVTCYTCHRGNPLPEQRWFLPVPHQPGNNLLANATGQNAPSAKVLNTSLPSDPFLNYLWKPDTSRNIRVVSTAALPEGNESSVKKAEQTYGLMVHISKSLGVNCTFCHNSRSFSSWAQSPLQRTTAWHGIRMARDVNSNYLEPLGSVFPPSPEGRLGPTGDSAKVNCATCHQGVNKPLNGAKLARSYPALFKPEAVAEAASAATAGQPPAAASGPAASPAAPSASDAELMARHGPASAPVQVALAAPAPSAPPTPTPTPAPARPAAPAPVVAAAPVAAPHPVSATPVALPAAPPAVAAATGNCIDLAAQAARQGTLVAGETAGRVVTGNGKLSFYAAPDKACEMQGVYIMAGENVDALMDHNRFTAVRYQRPNGGAEAAGWVPADRLKPNGRGVLFARAAGPALASVTAPVAPVTAPVAGHAATPAAPATPHAPPPAAPLTAPAATVAAAAPAARAAPAAATGQAGAPSASGKVVVLPASAPAAIVAKAAPTPASTPAPTSRVAVNPVAAEPAVAKAPPAAAAASAALPRMAAAASSAPAGAMRVALAASAAAPADKPVPSVASNLSSGSLAGHCKDGDAAASKAGTLVVPTAAGRQVVGSGRLQFHGAPDAGCKLAGVFILPGEAVEALVEQGEYTSVRYVNPRNGNVALGWVLTARLEAGARPVARRP